METMVTMTMVSIFVVKSMSSSSSSVLNRILNSSKNSIFFDPICLVSALGCLLVINYFLSTSTSSLMLLITSLWSLPDVDLVDEGRTKRRTTIRYAPYLRGVSFTCVVLIGAL